MTRKTLSAGAVALLALGAAACDAGLTDLNRNPNSPEDVPASTLFTNAARVAVSRWLGSGYDLRGAEFVVQHLAEVQYPDEDRYARLTGPSTEGYFNGAYVSSLEDLQKVVAKGKAEQQPGTWAPGSVMKTWEFSYLTNTWGDVPYSQALQGDSAGAPVTPAYEPQQQIFADFFSKLDAASAALGGAQNTLGSADPIYGGKPAQWQKFSNSLRARLALLTVNVDRALADAQLKAAFAAPGGIITSNANTASLAWPGDGVYNNPWADNFKTRDDHRVSNTLINVLKATNDPRLAVYAMPTQADPSTYAGMPNGLLASDAAPYSKTASRPGAVFYPGGTAYGTYGGNGASQPSYLFTAAEGNLIKAEAAERGLGGLTPAQAAEFYRAGIRASMQQWGVPDAQVDAYLAQPSVAYKGGVEGLRQIAREKWVALYTDGGTAWAEWRRTCVPSTIKPGPAAISDIVPRRFQYSTTEYQVNGDAVRAALEKQGADQFATRFWWDKSPSAAPTFTAGCGQR